jgi:hypothetical protein
VLVSSILSFDETNFKDDPPQPEGPVQEGKEVCGEGKNTTKLAVTKILHATMSPYIIYNDMNLYDSWTRGLATTSQKLADFTPVSSGTG